MTPNRSYAPAFWWLLSRTCASFRRMFDIEREILRRMRTGEPVTLPMLTLFAVPWLVGIAVFCIALFGAAVVSGGN